MSQTWLYSFLSVLAASLISLVGIATISLKKKTLKKIIFFLVAFSAGALLGEVFIHIVPETGEEFGYTFSVSAYFLLGIIIFFILEKFLYWRHCHDIDCKEHNKRLGIMNMVGDGFHNMIDGMLIAGSFLMSVPLGIATTIAVAAHEIPQELGDFGVLIHSGFTKKKALFYNLISGLVSLVGMAMILAIGSKGENLSGFLLPFTGGSFVYIAASGMIPELHKEVGFLKSLIQLLGLLLGIGVMTALLLV